MSNINIKLRISDLLFMICMIFVLAFPGSPRIKAIPIILFFCYMMALKITKPGKINNNLHLIGLLLFLGYAYISRNWAAFPAAVHEQFSNVLWSVLLGTATSAYIIHNNLTPKDISNRLIPIVLLFLFNVLVNGSFIEGRISIGINENSFGRLSAGMACFFFYQCKKEHWTNLFLDIITGVLWLLVLLSGSRTAILITAIHVLAIILFEHPTKNAANILGKILLILVLCFVGYFLMIKVDVLYQAIGNRIESLLLTLAGISKNDGSFISRMNMMNLARNLFLERPMLGIGLNNFKYATYYNTYAHNNYFELAACLGIVGLIFYYLPFAEYLKRAIRRWKKNMPWQILPLAILAAFFIGDLGSVSYFNMITHVFLGLAIGLLNTKSATT